MSLVPGVVDVDFILVLLVGPFYVLIYLFQEDSREAESRMSTKQAAPKPRAPWPRVKKPPPPAPPPPLCLPLLHLFVNLSLDNIRSDRPPAVHHPRTFPHHLQPRLRLMLPLLVQLILHIFLAPSTRRRFLGTAVSGPHLHHHHRQHGVGSLVQL